MAQDPEDAAVSLQTRAERHRLLSDPTRLAIVEALREGPREISELARITGVHRNTVRAHLDRLEEAGALVSEPVPRAGRGRPALQYRLREHLTLDSDGYRILIEGLVQLVREARSGEAAPAAEDQGAELGRKLGRHLAYPTSEQAVREVTAILEQLSFAPSTTRDGERYEIELRNCPFWGGLAEEHGEVICSFHLGLIRGVAEVTSGDSVQVTLHPFVEQQRLCRVLIESTEPDPEG